MKTNSIGLNEARTVKIVENLNQLLANYQQFYMNLRGFHWNVKGKSFFELHLKFEELYTDVNLKVDEIAERILALEGKPLHSFSDYLALTTLKEEKDRTNGAEIVGIILSNFKVLISSQRSVLALANENEDEGTATLMSDYITLQEKTVWMLGAYLG